MGDKDRSEKLLMACRDVFAELVNVLVYQGERVLTEEGLLPGPTESIYPGRHEKLAGQFQDYSMYEVVRGEIQALYTVENQSSVDYQMVLRHVGYEGAAYRRQYRQGKKTGQTKLEGQPLPEGWGIYPVISLVLNWGEKRWSAVTAVRELIDRPVRREAEDYVDKNRMHVFDMRFMDAMVRSRFEGDARVILDYLSDRESLIRRRQELRNPEEVMRMLHALSGDTRYLEHITRMKKEGGSTVCDLLDEMLDKGIAIGKKEGIKEGIREGKQKGIKEGIREGKQKGIEEGIREGKQKGIEEGIRKGMHKGIQEGIKALISTCKEWGISFDETASKVKEKFCLGEEEARNSMKLYW